MNSVNLRLLLLIFLLSVINVFGNHASIGWKNFLAIFVNCWQMVILWRNSTIDVNDIDQEVHKDDCDDNFNSIVARYYHSSPRSKVLIVTSFKQSFVRVFVDCSFSMQWPAANLQILLSCVSHKSWQVARGLFFSFYHHVLFFSDCEEVKSEDYQNCSVLYCVTQLCTTICTLI